MRLIQAGIDTKTPAELLGYIIKKTGYDEFIRDGTPKSEDRETNLDALLSDAQQFNSLDDFLEETALLSGADESAGDDTVTLMTLHAAKGLEFPVVYMVGMEEGILPHSRVFESDPADLEEERRLCYVGMTRARQELHLTYAHSRLQFGQRGYNQPSRFLAEIDAQIVAKIEHHSRSMDEVYDDFSDNHAYFDTGDRVRSPAFGIGTIEDVDGLAVTVSFDSGTTKQLNVEYARLEKLA
jgi:DNA helicase-2/ATP-dependent DNA helicase PcrA